MTRILLSFAAIALLSACSADRLTGPLPENADSGLRPFVVVSGIDKIISLENVGDIENIEVVKGAAAAAIYGVNNCSAIWVIVSPCHSKGGSSCGSSPE